MAGSGQRSLLTKEEFERLLQRAAERHVLSEPRPFTVEELVEAGHELGIAPATVREVYQEHQRGLARPAGRQRPFDSTLRMEESGDILRLTIPPRRGNQIKAGVQVLGLVAFTTMMAMAGSALVFVAGSSLLTAGLGYLALRSARTTRELRLKRDGGGALVRMVGRDDNELPLQAGQVHVRLAERTVGSEGNRKRIPFVALDHGTETIRLLEGYSHAEQAWFVETVERWLGR